MIVGDPAIFAVESLLTEPVESVSQLALGFFVIHVGGRCYGVRTPDATMLGCSVDSARQRIIDRGCHVVELLQCEEALDIAEAYLAAMYDEARQAARFFGLSADEWSEQIASGKIAWAPDGDEAFDDGSHVLQFDLGRRVRIIAFHNLPPSELQGTLSEVELDAGEFYGILEAWLKSF